MKSTLNAEIATAPSIYGGLGSVRRSGGGCQDIEISYRHEKETSNTVEKRLAVEFHDSNFHPELNLEINVFSKVYTLLTSAPNSLSTVMQPR